MSETTRLACACGQFHLEVTGAPFITTECHCNSCRAAAGRLAALPLARPMTEANSGTSFVLYRKDRVAFPHGTATLRGYRLADTAPTRRVVTTCCNSPVFLEFQGAHWLSLYASLWPEATRPPTRIRTMTGDRPAGAPLDAALPAGGLVTAGFYAKLLAAWIAMGFKTPKIAIGEERVA